MDIVAAVAGLALVLWLLHRADTKARPLTDEEKLAERQRAALAEVNRKYENDPQRAPIWWVR